jgi:hypothetical protein
MFVRSLLACVMLSTTVVAGCVDYPYFGRRVPYCEADVATINGTGSDELSRVAIDDEVVLTSSRSFEVDPNGDITAQSWALVDAPPGSSVLLSATSGAETTFERADGEPGFDLPGRYTALVELTNDAGNTSFCVVSVLVSAP